MNRSNSRPNAIARINGANNAPNLFGEVKFYQKPTSVLIEANISNLPKNSETGFFAFHIHEGDNCFGDDFANTGSHYNPEQTPHPRHAGDLPPLLFCQGGAYLSVKTDRFRVDDIIGRTVVIHSGTDDFITQPAGNAGKKIACGVIRRV